MDNASYHKSKRVRQLLKKYPNVMLDYLPSYSPEYNPVEQIWRWLKKIVHGVETIDNGIYEMLSRMRKTIWHWKNGNLVNTLNVGNGIWDDLVTNIYGK